MSEHSSVPPLLDADPCVIASIDGEHVHLISSRRGTVVVSAAQLGHRPSSPLWEGASVMLVTLRHRDVSDDIHIPILEPDYLTDVTEIADAWLPGSSSAETILFNRLRSRTTSMAMARGSLLNNVFDLAVVDALVDHEASDDELIARALQANLLPWAAFAHRGVELEKALSELLPVVVSMRRQLRAWLTPTVSDSTHPVRLRVEPHAISPVLGLAGRFDILLESDRRTTLVELKSGTPPRRGGRPSHIAQLSCYAALHLAVEGRWPDDVLLWYAAHPEPDMALRPVTADEILRTVHSLLQLRNATVSMDHALAQRTFGALRNIGPSMPGVSDFAQDAAERFQDAYAAADPVVRTASQGWLSMLHRERWVQRLGTTESAPRSVRARADLWRESLETKRNDPSCITDLVIDVEASNFERMHLSFRRDQPIEHTSLRHGDLVILHQQRSTQPNGRFIIKATVEALHESSVRLSLRNKQIDQHDLLTGSWIIEVDLSDKSIRDAMPGAVALLAMSARRQNLLLGRTPAPIPPEVVQPPTPAAVTEATPVQVRVIRQALAQPELFLLQGPPGTGKTNIALRSIVATLAAKPDERVLVLAFTNRAVSEICAALSTVLPHDQFIRHGSKVGSDETQDVAAIPHLARTLSAQDLAERIATARVVVATMSSIVSSAEIFEFGTFTTAIVDEASQLIEPLVLHIALRVHRLILIGDHAQLPPVITQPTAHLAVNAPLLHDVGLDHLGQTTFERLFTIYQSRGWTDGSAMLVEQGRMHQDVMTMPSSMFYGERLQPVLEWQRSSEPLPWHDMLPHRAIFIPVRANRSEHQHTLEVATITWLLGSMFPEESSESLSVGVITPFRLQNHAMLLAVSGLAQRVSSTITIDTVERFQGSQRDVIIYGTAVATSTDLRTITSETRVDGRVVDRKLNVACTRARQQFIMLGHPEILSQSESYAEALRQLPWVHLQDRIDLPYGRS